MDINKEIYNTLTECNISHNNAIPILLCHYFGLSVPSYVPDILRQKLNITGIVTLDNHGTPQWNIPLFDAQETAFDWVEKEYCQMFKEVGKPPKVRECVSRMKDLFAKNPDIRKEDVLGGTRMYLFNQGDPRYIKNPHYFILKGVGVNKVQDILEWVEKYSTTKRLGEGRTSLSNTIQ